MDDVDIRFECVRLAIQHKTAFPPTEGKYTSDLAAEIYNFVTAKPKPEAVSSNA
jgi:hypothetical protein